MVLAAQASHAPQWLGGHDAPESQVAWPDADITLDLPARIDLGVVRGGAVWSGRTYVCRPVAGVGAIGVGGTLFGPQGLFAVGPLLTLPIFNAGRIRAGVESTEAQQQAALWRYLQSIQQAFREVSDALVEYRQQQESLVQQEALTRTWQDAIRLSRRRYEGGVTSFLEVLDTERQLFLSELDLVRAQLAVRLAVVQLYKALGGGWQL